MWTLTSPTWFVSTLMSPDGNGVYINLFCILRPSSHFTDYWIIFFFFSSFFLFQWSLFDHDTLRQRRGRFFFTWLTGCMVSTHTVICTWWNCYVDCFTQTWCIVRCKVPVFIGSVGLNARVIATRVYHAKYKVFWESKCNYKIEVTVEIGYT